MPDMGSQFDRSFSRRVPLRGLGFWILLQEELQHLVTLDPFGVVAIEGLHRVIICDTQRCE